MGSLLCRRFLCSKSDSPKQLTLVPPLKLGVVGPLEYEVLIVGKISEGAVGCQRDLVSRRAKPEAADSMGDRDSLGGDNDLNPSSDDAARMYPTHPTSQGRDPIMSPGRCESDIGHSCRGRMYLSNERPRVCLIRQPSIGRHAPVRRCGRLLRPPSTKGPC